MKDYKKILQLNSEGKSKNEISQCLGYQWRTVSDILKKAEEANVTYEQAKLLSRMSKQNFLTTRPCKNGSPNQERPPMTILSSTLNTCTGNLLIRMLLYSNSTRSISSRLRTCKKRPIPKASFQRSIRISQQTRRFRAMSKASRAESWNWILQGMSFLFLTGA